MEEDFITPVDGVIFGYQPCQTRDAKWLCLENVFQKCYRPHMYDIGGTYIEDLPHYWFYYKIEIVGKLFLLHLFVNSRREGTFYVSVSSSSEILYRKKQGSAFLPSLLKTKKISGLEMSQNYITTYSFAERTVEVLKDLKLYIPILFENVYHNRYSNVQRDFGALLDDPYGADFIIESADGVKFEAHKILLSACSEVFRAMLKENTAESQNSYMKMVDVNKEDVKCVIEFIYTGTLKDIEGSNFLNLLMLADRYNLVGLRDLSENALATQLTIDNVIETIAAAELYNAEGLKISALKFLKCNNVAIHSSMFEELNNAKLVREICQFLVQS